MPTSTSPLPSPKYLEEDNLTQECTDLLSTLPRGKGWVATHLYQYHGFWFTSRNIQGLLFCRKHFEANDSDVLLATTPKSGTTWLKAVTFALLNRRRYPVTGATHHQDHPLLTNNPHELVPFLETKLYAAGKELPDLQSMAAPRLFSTHLPPVLLTESIKTSKCKIVYLCRNPRDTFVSLWHFTNKLKPPKMEANSFEEVFDRFCEGLSLNGPFWDHVLAYWRESLENPKKVLFLKYEEMKERPVTELRRLAEFVGCPFTAEEVETGVVDGILELCSFENLSNLEVNRSGKLEFGEENRAFFRRGEVGDWKNYLSPKMAERLDRISEETFCGSGLKM